MKKYSWKEERTRISREGAHLGEPAWGNATWITIPAVYDVWNKSAIEVFIRPGVIGDAAFCVFVYEYTEIRKASAWMLSEGQKTCNSFILQYPMQKRIHRNVCGCIERE